MNSVAMTKYSKKDNLKEKRGGFVCWFGLLAFSSRCPSTEPASDQLLAQTSISPFRAHGWKGMYGRDHIISIIVRESKGSPVHF